MDNESVDTYLAAAAAFVDQVERVAALGADAWAGPGLGEWDLRSLVGHASRSLVTVLTYLQQPAPEVAVERARDYLAAVRLHVRSAGGDEVTERGRQAGLALGPTPAASVRELLDQVTTALAGVTGDPVITTIAGGMRVSDYLPTRTFELVVHTLDITRACGVEVTLPDQALAQALALTTDAAVGLGEGRAVLSALTGRGPLPAGYNVVG